jgi:hypothetical protein
VGGGVSVLVGVAVEVSTGSGAGVFVRGRRGVFVGRAVTVGGASNAVLVGNGVGVAKGVNVRVGVFVGIGVPTVGVLVDVRVDVGVRVLAGVRVGRATLVCPPVWFPSGSSPRLTMGPSVDNGVGVGSLTLPPESVGFRSHPANNQNATIVTALNSAKAIRRGNERARTDDLSAGIC